jgi:hypothetical protein
MRYYAMSSSNFRESIVHGLLMTGRSTRYSTGCSASLTGKRNAGYIPLISKLLEICNRDGDICAKSHVDCADASATDVIYAHNEIWCGATLPTVKRMVRWRRVSTTRSVPSKFETILPRRIYVRLFP